MTFGELLDEERIEGQNMLLALIGAMTADGRDTEISRLAMDKAFREDMFARYHITDHICEVQNV